MLHHSSFAVSDIARSAAFYDAVLPTLGYICVWANETAVGYGSRGVTIPGDGFHVAFSAPSQEAVDRFYKTALEHGGIDNGGSGFHPEYGAKYFAAFVIDPDGYRIEAVLDHPV